MSLERYLQSLGRWDIRLDNMPERIYREVNHRGHVLFLPGKVNIGLLGTGATRDTLVQSKSIYTGIVHNRKPLGGGSWELSGTHATWWLGDEEGRGELYKVTKEYDGVAFETVIPDLAPQALVEGDVSTSVPGTYIGEHFGQSPREAFDYVCETMGAEWRVNDDFTYDAGLQSDLYVTSPKAIVVRRGVSLYESMRAIRAAEITQEEDSADWISEALIAGSGDFAGGGEDIILGEADLVDIGESNPFKDPQGNDLIWRQLFNEPVTFIDNADPRAQVLLQKAYSFRVLVSINVLDFDTNKKTYDQGDVIYIYDPPDLVDFNNPIPFGGGWIPAKAVRIFGYSNKPVKDMTVLYRDQNANYTDLTPYAVSEEGSTTLHVGDKNRSPFDPEQGLSAKFDGLRLLSSNPTIPDKVTTNNTPWFQFNYEDSNGVTYGAVQVEYNLPLNTAATGGGTINDGRSYEIRYRLNGEAGQWKFESVNWGILSYTLYGLEVGAVYNIGIRAIDLAGQAGDWSDSEVVTVVADTTGPSKPGVPGLTAGPLEIFFAHTLDKDGDSNYTLEPDIAKLEIHASTTGPGFTPSANNLIGSIDVFKSNLDLSVPAVAHYIFDTDDELDFKVRAVDRSGNASPYSDAQTVRPLLIQNRFIVPGAYSNEIRDPSFQKDDSIHDLTDDAGGTWDIFSTVTRDRSGGKVLRYNPSGQTGNADCVLNGGKTDSKFHTQVVGGTEFFFGFYARKETTGTAGDVRPLILWRYADGSSAGSDVGSLHTLTNTYTAVSMVATAPDDAVYAVYVIRHASGGTAVAYFDDCFATKVVVTDELTDFNVTEPKLEDAMAHYIEIQTGVFDDISLNTTWAELTDATLTIPSWVGDLTVIAMAGGRFTNGSGGVQRFDCRVDLGGAVINELKSHCSDGEDVSISPSAGRFITSPGSSFTADLDAQVNTGTNGENGGRLTLIGFGRR